MTEPYLGEIRSFGFTFAPRGWAQCNGQILSISQNSALFSILGTTYGGDGVTNFALPNLEGRSPMHWGSGPGGFNTVIGEVQGQTAVTLLATQIPQHMHTALAAAAGAPEERSAVPGNTSFISGSKPPDLVYLAAPPALTSQFSNRAISVTGGSQPHDNMQPYLVLNFCIALEGIFPPHS